MNEKYTTWLRISCQVLATIFLIAAVALTLAALVTPDWQHVYIPIFTQWQYFGLFMDCTQGVSAIYTTNSDGYSCNFKFGELGENNGQFTGEDHLGWHRHVIGLLIAAIVFAIIGLICSFIAPCEKHCALPWCVFTFVAEGCSVAGIIIFFVNSSSISNRYVQAANSSYEKSYGAAYWSAVFAVLMYLLAVILAVLTTVFYYTKKKKTVVHTVHYDLPKDHGRLSFSGVDTVL